MGATILADVATTLAIVLPIVGLVIGAAAGILIYIVLMRNKIGKSKQLAKGRNRRRACGSTERKERFRKRDEGTRRRGAEDRTETFAKRIVHR